MTLLLVAVASALGAVARFLTDRWVQSRHRQAFPWGTLLVNVSGSFLIGVLTGWAAHRGLDARLMTVAAVGLLGSYTTFSTVVYEAVRLGQAGRWLLALVDVVGSMGAGLAAVGAGWWLAGTALGG